MFPRKLACLLLALVFALSTAVPVALADGTPPSQGGGDIHPWDNNDDYHYGGGPVLSSSQPAIILYGYSFNGRLFTVRVPIPLSWWKANTSNGNQSIRLRSDLDTKRTRTLKDR